MVYRGPGDGITVYHDGVEVARDAFPSTFNPVTSSGIIKISRRFDPPGDALYGSVYLDELLFWNQILVQSEIEIILGKTAEVCISFKSKYFSIKHS